MQGINDISTSEKREQKKCAAFADKFIPQSWTDQIKISQQTRRNRPKEYVPKPPPAPARAPATPKRGPTALSKPVRYKAALISLKQAPAQTSTSSIQPNRLFHRLDGSTPPDPLKARPPWGEGSQPGEQGHSTRKTKECT